MVILLCYVCISVFCNHCRHLGGGGVGGGGFMCRPGVGNKILGGIPGMSQGGGDVKPEN